MLIQNGILEELTTRLAPFLQQYPGVEIVYRNKTLDPSRLQSRTARFEVTVPDSDDAAQLVIIEWNVKVDRLMFLCDEQGNALTEMAPGIRPGPFQFTAYLCWQGFTDMGHNVLLADLGGGAAEPLVEAAKEKLREYFKERQRDREREVISDWEAQGIYPYTTEATTPTEVAERQVFDVVALTAASVVNDAPEKSRRLSLSLIKTALETSPAVLHDVLINVLELPADRIEELRQLLDRTTLAAS